MSFVSLRGLILSIAFFTLTLVAQASAKEEAHIKIPVVPLNIKQGMISTGETPQHIEIHVLGPSALLETLSSLKLTYGLDLADMGIGPHVISVCKDCVKLPQGLSIAAINPPQIHVRLDEEIEKELPLKIYFKGKPAPGYAVAKTLAIPNRVLLKGPKQLIDGIQHISTVPIDVTGVSESFKKEVPLVLIENVQIVPTSSPIIAQVDIEELIITKTIKDLRVQGRDTSHAFQISPALITIQVKGPANALTELSSKDDFNIYINLKDLQPGVFVRRATIELPIDITLIGVEPKIFTVTIK
jgi:YbbR domain-containing protein